MQEERITFETAKIAKEKGFGNQVREDGSDKLFFPKAVPYDQCFNMNTGKLITPKTYNPKNPHALAPTQSLLQKWLRDVHGEDVFVIKSVDRYYPVNNTEGLSIKDMAHLMTVLKWESYSTYEEALEKILFETLKQI